MAAPAAANKDLDMFVGVTKSGAKVVVRPRADRRPLLSLYEGSKQLAQVVVDWFDDQNIGIRILNTLAGEYVAGSRLRENMISRRDELLTEAGVTTGRVLKRPAAAKEKDSVL